jgi:serine/threonine-protein kinase RsbW
MLPNNHIKSGSEKQILGRVPRRDFVGRENELDRIVGLASGRELTKGILVHSAPAAGSSELLRQAFDVLFEESGGVAPLYFAFSLHDKTTKDVAQHFLHSALLQYIAYKRNDSDLCCAVLSPADLIELALPSDVDWVERIIGSAEREYSSGHETSYLRTCLSVIRRMQENAVRPLLMIDHLQLSDEFLGDANLAYEFARAAVAFGTTFVFCGLRRELSEQFNGYNEVTGNASGLHLERLGPNDARTVVERTAKRFKVSINEQTRDLVAQEFDGSPLFITSFLQAAAEGGNSLLTFKDCQQVYVDDVMGGRIGRYYGGILDRISPSPSIRRGLIRLLYESRLIDNGRLVVDVLRRRLELDSAAAHLIARKLNGYELASLNSTFLDVQGDSLPWTDYLHTRYRLDVAAEPRALVFADTLVNSLKRAPQTMARHYRRESALGLRQTLGQFNCQRIPASLLHYDRFKRTLKGASEDEIAAALDTESELIRLPQVVHVGICSDFDHSFQQHGDDERCAVAHGFEAGSYSDGNETVWLAAEIESKLEAGRGLAEMWCDRLQKLARSCGFSNPRLWLVAPEGFSDDAMLLLNDRGVYSSSRHQFELLSARLSLETSVRTTSDAVDEFEMVIPMGEDSELIAAKTVEQIARRIEFQPEAINQIKTALVEACINASEHSLSPDRKIYQRFRVESDKLVVTVSSRGLVPGAINGLRNRPAGDFSGADREWDASKGRRGWGLKLIQSLMDEVEFETVDDGTSLRMTKYLKKG